jgi:predicted transcriptional regulator YdeE
MMLRRMAVPAALLTLLAAGYMVAEEINMVKLHVDSFIVAGYATETSNAFEASPEARIGPLWQRLASEHYLSRIPNRVDDRVVAVYSNYENGTDGMYSYLLGAKVSSRKNMPADIITIDVQSGQYAMFTEQGGPPPQMTVDLWKHIWSLEKPGGILHRAYKTDFEVHYATPDDPDKSKVDIYIGVTDKK